MKNKVFHRLYSLLVRTP